jgi:DNA-binding transcriptional ArsR family regulator
MVSLFKALSDETRLRILNLLREKELCVCELMEVLEMPQPRISHQLRILKEAGLVVDRREGKWIIYALEERGKERGKEDPASSVLRILHDSTKEGVWERDRTRLQQTVAKGVRASCWVEPPAAPMKGALEASAQKRRTR